MGRVVAERGLQVQGSGSGRLSQQQHLQVRERLVSISTGASWLFLRKTSFHKTVSW